MTVTCLDGAYTSRGIVGRSIRGEKIIFKATVHLTGANREMRGSGCSSIDGPFHALQESGTSHVKDRCVAHEPNTDVHMFFTLYVAGRDSGGRVHGCSRCAKCMPFTGVRAHVIRCKCDVSSRQLEMVYRSEGGSQNGHQQRESRCRGCREDVPPLQAIWQLREHRCSLKVGCRGRRHHRVAGSH